MGLPDLIPQITDRLETVRLSELVETREAERGHLSHRQGVDVGYQRDVRKACGFGADHRTDREERADQEIGPEVTGSSR